jgi:miniconductance mechanosensitive channel
VLGRGVPPGLARFAGLLAGTAYLFLLALLANLLAKRLIAGVIHPLIHRTDNKWDDILVESGVIVRFSHLVPAAALHFFAPAVFEGHARAIEVLGTVVNVYLLIIALYVIDAGLNSFRAVWERGPAGRRFPAKSFTQAAKLVVNLVGAILLLSVLLGKSPLVFFSGLGAITAILLLIFKDAILGLVAGIQLSVNQMVAAGDWIEMPARGADGDVIDVSLTTVKVRNWDKTITTIPTYALISDSFKNWQGMAETGGRRIKRCLHLDLRTLRFSDEEQLERFKRIRLLRPYLEAKLQEIQKHNDDVGDDLAELINGRRLTNIGTFRAYCLAYLKQHPRIRQDLTLLVRQLEPTATGLPLQIYAFANDTAWANYENIQSDIFDHLLAVLPDFGLSAFQNPSGADVERGLGRMVDGRG